MGREWTKEQKAALESKNSTIVSASAGAGKTAVLTEKVFNYIMSGIGIKNILIMTFSNKAAEEMKERIVKKINDAIDEIRSSETEKNKGAKIKWLYEQLNDIPRANIQTIHSFCKNVIKKYFYMVNVDPRFSIADEMQSAVLKASAVKTILDEQYAMSSEIFNTLYSYIDNSTDIESVIISGHNSLMPIYQPYKWLETNVNRYDIDTTTIPDYIYNEIENDFSSALNIYKELKEKIVDANDKALSKALDIVSSEYNTIKLVLDALYSNDIAAINPKIFSDFGAIIRFPKNYSHFKDIRNLAKDPIVEKYKKTNFDLQEELNHIKAMYPLAKFYQELLISFNDEYRRLKDEKKLIDFSDMEQMACTILHDPAASTFYKEYFAYVFVDEYQDTSPIQEEIINLVSRNNNLFCVGDLKQSIYRFRSSDPLLFKTRLTGYEGKSNKTIVKLNQNFRSSANILNCANDVFFNIVKESEEITYASDDALVHGRNESSHTDPSVKINLITNGNTDISDDEIEAQNIANFIKSRVGKPIYDSDLGTERMANYDDITVLSRKILKYSDTLAAVFIKEGIPFEIEKTGNLFETTEIKTLLALLELIINRNNDLNILTIMHQGLFGFNDNDILSVRNYNSIESYYKNISDIAEKNHSDLSQKCAALISFLRICNDKQHLYSLSKMVNYVIDRSNINDAFAVRINGRHKLENIKLFSVLANNYEKSSHGKVYSFLKFIDDMNNTSQVQGEAKATSSINKVKITTIHKSKGLEYPIVVLAYMGKTFSALDKKENIILDRDAGLGIKYYDPNKNIRNKNLLRTNIESTIEKKNREEEMRLLYVAMTRAKEEMVIQSVSHNENIPALEACKSMNDWIINSVLTVSDSGLTIKPGLKGNWEVVSISDNEIIPTSTDESKAEISLPVIDSKNIIPVRKHIEKEPPIPKAISASCISSVNKFSESDFALPKFMSTNKSADIGTVVHKIMRYGKFKISSSDKDITEEISRLKAQNIVAEDEVKLISNNIIQGIAEYTKSDCYKRLLTSSTVLKETQFYTNLSSKDINISDDDKPILTRCIIDLAYVDGNEITLVDFKTDRVSDETINDNIQHHMPQIDVYTKCLEDTYGKPVINRYIVFLSAGQICPV